MNAISGINHVGISVAEVSRTRAFYEQSGSELVAGPPGAEAVAIMRHPSGVTINFILNADAGSAENVLMDFPQRYRGYTHMALDSDDIQAVESGNGASGIGITGGPLKLPDGAVMFFICDPGGNVIGFHQNP